MQGKVVIITGATSGIGRACAFMFGQAGAKVAITGRNTANLENTRAYLQTAGIEVLAIQADVSIEADCKRMANEVIARFGGIDILINNAGISMRALFSELDLDVLHQVFAINFWGTVYCTKYCLPAITARKGSIVGVSSIAGVRALPARTGYSASKAAMQGFLESLRVELLHTGVHVLVALPGFTASNIRNTALTANGQAQKESPRDESKLMTSEAVAGAILQAVKKRKRTLVLTTQGKLTVFLQKFIPQVLDKITFNMMAAEPDSPLKK